MTTTRSGQGWQDREGLAERRPPAAVRPSPSLWRALRIAVWSVAHFLFYFAQQVAELAAPLLLVLGIGWWTLPRILSAISAHAATADAQARDMLGSLPGAVPQSIELAGHHLTPGMLIGDGLLLMAVAALGATLSALAARGM
ncbi:hypothetical protein [Rhizosaccharibacter radicis]|uniref:AI-2E family transporter n=1 Tax=Rhizosaccharibacter radicis TaxID=2782605 RepID=A0ABT1VX90_9PROT|nr:hypothetical protein [Acetobacteraceae bacterium KSS12]